MSPPAQGLYDPSYEHDSCGIGFVADVKGRRSNAIVRLALRALVNLRHRGACGCEANTGDGAGILLQTPDGFLRKAAAAEGIRLPPAGEYGVAMVFLPREPLLRADLEARLRAIVEAEGQRFLGWRSVPTDPSPLGASARSAEPCVRQAFIGRGKAADGRPPAADGLDFERRLYVIRRVAENAIRYGAIPGGGKFYLPSCSSRTLVYKGMLKADQIEPYYPDLSDPDVATAIGVVHSRFSTNTFPSWERAHPYRYVIHNGEINTLRGNINGMRAREARFRSPLFGEELRKILPVIATDGSDSAMFDNCLEFLVLSGRSLPHAVMMMIPEPWQNHESMSEAKKAFYEYHASLMEPWDGPASIGFTDGVRVGAVLDRNGLRPSRYYVTKGGLVVLASEVGVVEFPPEEIAQKGRLQPGRMLLVDTAQGRIVADEEIKEGIAAERPYREWLEGNLTPLPRLSTRPPAAPSPVPPPGLLPLQRAFGYTLEDLRIILAPMARDGVEPVGSMGTDTPLAVLSERPQLLYSYFKQLFAQVTNPPIDANREELITSMVTTIGAEENLLDPGPLSCRQLRLESPVLSDEQMETIRALDRPGLRARTLDAGFDPAGGGAALERALEELFAEADRAIEEGATILILSDRGEGPGRAPIPALLAVSGLHHHLIRKGTRTRVGLVVESGEPREVHHFALLIGYGAGAVNPWLALESVRALAREGPVGECGPEEAADHYLKASGKGVVKVISKMGISTIHSYRGAQIFEAVGLSAALVERYFTGTASRVEGIGIEEIAREAALRHAHAFPAREVDGHALDPGGHYQWRQDGERHLFNPETVHKLQTACRTGNYRLFQEYAEQIDRQERRLCTLRGMLELKAAPRPVKVEEVEPVEAIVRRFKTGAMSYGSISKEAHEALAIAMNRLGGKSNTGEGGEDPARYVPDPNGDSRNSAIKQVASARFGVTSLYLVNARELQIKMAQGAKPGEGGQIPGHKVYPWIAKVRYSTPGVGLISPPPHHDIYSIEDLAELIHDLKNANPDARISVKLVAEVGVGTIAAGVAKAHADVVLISGHDGGTGASPQTSIKHAGLPWELGLAETHQTLVLNNLRSRIAVETDGQLKTGRDVAIAALLGAEEFGFATAPLVALGCVMMRVCHLNTCPVGVATQDPVLRRRFTGDPAHAVTFMRFIAEQVREHLARLGFRTLEEAVGRTDRLEFRRAADHWKARGVDLSRLLHFPEAQNGAPRSCRIAQDHGLDRSLDRQALLELCRPALERGEKVEAALPITNSNRVVATMVGSAVTKRWGAQGLPEDTIRLLFRGSAGQSFGAFVPRGVTLVLEGDANDYAGKGLSGGKIVAFPPKGSTFAPEENILVGNVALYGATSGEAYLRGMAGERFAVRNSGVRAVVEAVGDHGCEYMTGGRVVVLGPTGRNFGAGMSGGIAYVLDEKGDFKQRCNPSMVELFALEDPAEIEEVRELVRRHADHTGSERAGRLLSAWEAFVPKFVKVYPKDYRRAQETLRRMEAQGLSGDEAVMAAFEENAKDRSRVGGN